jgi:hypothetical protein
VIRALRQSDSIAGTYQIFALTRSSKSQGAKYLASLPNVSIVEGDLDNPEAVFEKVGALWGVYSVQIASPGKDIEETQGKALVDAAIKHDVRHFVYS